VTTTSEDAPPSIPGLEYVRPLGAGGYSHVYLYEQATPKRQVAVKVLKNAGLTEAVRRQFTEEANAMAALEHPNIVGVITADVASDGRPYLVMPFYPRHNLGVRAASERFSVSEVLKIGIQISSAVETAHRAGILHRDIKPANILTDQYGTVGLTDFGIATQATAIDEDEDTGVSVPWAAPETIFATAPASVQSDVYSLGATLWQLLVGRSPFEVVGSDNGQFDLMPRIKSAPVPSTGRADAPASLERLLAQSMAKDPAVRPPSALDFARSLQSIEQELRLARTEIVVLTEEVTPARAHQESSADVNATRQRAQRIDAQGPAASPAPPLAPAMPPSPAPPLPAPPQFVDPVPAPTPALGPAASSRAEATVRRAPVVSPGPAPVVPTATVADESASRVRPVWALVALGVVILVVIVVGILVMSGGSDDSGDRAATATTKAAGPDDIGPPGEPTVTGKRVDASTAEFSWTYSNDADSDTFRWQTTDGAKSGVADEPSVSIVSPAGQATCVQIKVVRADGSNAALSWSDEGCVS